MGMITQVIGQLFAQFYYTDLTTDKPIVGILQDQIILSRHLGRICLSEKGVWEEE